MRKFKVGDLVRLKEEGVYICGDVKHPKLALMIGNKHGVVKDSNTTIEERTRVRWDVPPSAEYSDTWAINEDCLELVEPSPEEVERAIASIKEALRE